MAPTRNQTIWLTIGMLVIWNLGLTILSGDALDWIVDLTEALRIVNESQLRGQYLNFVVETLMHHQDNLPTYKQLRDFIAVLEELQSKGVEINYTADFISNTLGKGSGPGPAGGSSGLSIPVRK